jgi:glycerol kinase
MRIRSRTVSSVILFACAFPPAAASAQALSPACQAVYDAMRKAASTPSHMVLMTDGKIEGEEITIDNVIYLKVRGQWTKSPMTTRDILEQEQRDINKITVSTCTALPAAAINGIAVDVYHTRHDTKDNGSGEATYWIAKATGLPLRTDIGEVASHRVAMSMRFDYDNIKAPMVQK